MAPLKAIGAAALDALAVPAAHAVFAQRRAVGLLLLLGLAFEPRCLVLGACALAGGQLAVRALRVANAYVPFGWNAMLCGIALGHDLALTPSSIAFAFVLGAGSALVSASLAALAAYYGYLPVLTIPFLLTTWFGWGIAPSLPLTAATPQLDVWAAALPAWPALGLQSFGTFLLVPDVRVGLCVLAALLLHSRIATLLAACAVFGVLGVLQLAHVPLATSTLQLTAASAGLAALAIGGVWCIPSRAASLLALGSAALSVFFALGLYRPLARLGLGLYFAPFQLAVLSVLSALRQRTQEHAPQLAKVVAETPEQLLLNGVATEVPALQLSLPYAGAWTCTQGVDGPYTHRGTLRHAYDFEIYSGAEGALCGGNGTRPQDYYCFAQPVLSAAEGTVIAIETSVPNNAVGEDNGYAPWGNYVLVQHAATAYSLIAHLAPGSIVVYPGQFVARGQILGYCGSSGRAPRPHVHFQMQTLPLLSSATQPSCFSDLIVLRDGRPRFEPSYTPQQGDTVERLTADYALAAYFAFPLGSTLHYRNGDKSERIVSELDGWARSRLRSLDRSAELLFTRSESRFQATELRGDPDSVLALLRLALPQVPLARVPGLTFQSSLPSRWLGGKLRRLLWELRAPLFGAQALEIESQLSIDARGFTILGSSQERGRDGAPVLRTRAVFGHTPGPQLLEVQAYGRVRRAELIVHPESRRALPNEASAHARSPLPLGLGDWT